MLDALKCYLESWGYPDIYVDTVPAPGEQRDMIALLEWDHTVGEVNDGTGTHYIQVQVRREAYADARALCEELFRLLDSGPEETLIDLTPEEFCIARPVKGPLKLESGDAYTTIYWELALWGRN